MHLLYFFTYGYSLKTWKDAGILSREIKPYLELIELGYSVTFITFGDSEDLKILTDQSKINVFPIYKNTKKTNFKFYEYLKSFLIPFKIKKKIPYFDVIKQNQLQGSWIAMILKLISGKPLYIRTGYDVFLFSKHEGKNYLKRFVYYCLTFLSLKYSNLYSVTSISDKIFLEKKFKKFKNKIVIRPNWVPKGISKDFEKRFNNKILMVGRLVSQKNYFQAIDLLQGLNIDLDIIGHGNLQQEIVRYAEKKNINISLINNLSNDEIIKVYGNYKIYLSTSLYEGNPKSLLEAMSSGCVPFVNNIANNREVVNNNNGFFIDFLNKKNFGINVKNIMSDEELFTRYSINATSCISKNNNLEKLVTSINEDLKSITKFNH